MVRLPAEGARGCGAYEPIQVRSTSFFEPAIVALISQLPGTSPLPPTASSLPRKFTCTQRLWRNTSGRRRRRVVFSEGASVCSVLGQGTAVVGSTVNACRQSSECESWQLGRWCLCSCLVVLVTSESKRKRVQNDKMQASNTRNRSAFELVFLGTCKRMFIEP